MPVLKEIKDADTIIDALDKEADEIMALFDGIIENAERHVQENLIRERKSQFSFQISRM